MSSHRVNRPIIYGFIGVNETGAGRWTKLFVANRDGALRGLQRRLRSVATSRISLGRGRRIDRDDAPIRSGTIGGWGQVAFAMPPGMIVGRREVSRAGRGFDVARRVKSQIG